MSQTETNYLPILIKMQWSLLTAYTTDSETVEKPMAIAIDNDLKMYFKIPSRFKIENPVGTHNPDYAIFIEKNGKKMYFVLETKGSANERDLRPNGMSRQKVDEQ